MRPEDNAFAGMNPDAIMLRLIELGEEHAEKLAIWRFYEDLEKSLLAQLTIKRMNGDKSRAQAEQEARACDEYTKHVRAGISAELNANKARVRYDSAKVWVDLMRSTNANRRAEMQMGGLIT